MTSLARARTREARRNAGVERQSQHETSRSSHRCGNGPPHRIVCLSPSLPQRREGAPDSRCGGEGAGASAPFLKASTQNDVVAGDGVEEVVPKSTTWRVD